MNRLRNILAKYMKRGPETGREGGSNDADAKETARLNAEYTGSFARNAGQELGILPPRYGRK